MGLFWRIDHHGSSARPLHDALFEVYGNRGTRSFLVDPGDRDGAEAAIGLLMEAEDVRMLTVWDVPRRHEPLRGRPAEEIQGILLASGARVVAFTFAHPLTAGSIWWEPRQPDLDDDFVRARIRDSFALVDFVVTDEVAQAQQGIPGRLKSFVVAQLSRPRILLKALSTPRVERFCEAEGWRTIGQTQGFLGLPNAFTVYSRDAATWVIE
ncbi:hypothetical protein [Nonomuraea sediminis]|uniref:hypothetical protein n=1 Tax=Nonomuraea sediminis TaxID=2835864 RepID=UPI001BDD38C2|nr:hypothetical protein [Nonomuraea sediminis]